MFFAVQWRGGRLPGGQFLLLMRDEPEEGRRERELQRRNREAVALYEIGRQISSSFDVDQVLSLIVKNMVWLLECHFAGVALPDHSDGSLAWRAAAGGKGLSQEGSLLPGKKGVVTKVMENLTPVFVGLGPDELVDDGGELQGLAAEGLRSILVLPLAHKGEPLGVLVGGYREAREVTEEDMRFFSNLADHAALALENAGLYQATVDDAKKLKALSSRLTLIQEQERGKISRELHDGIGQALTGIRFNLDLLCRETPITGGKAMERVGALKEIIDETLKDIRQMAFELRPAVLDDFGLAAALRQYVDRFEGQTGIATKLVSPEEVRRCGTIIEAAMYRVIQESLTNVAKHSHATEAQVELTAIDGLLVVDVRDNGAGFDYARWNVSPLPRGGFGLLNMKERITELDGVFRCLSVPGDGTHIHVEIPVSE